MSVHGPDVSCVPLQNLCHGASSQDAMHQKYCWRLAGSPDERFVLLRSSGYLEVRRREKWLPVCYHEDNHFNLIINLLCDKVVSIYRDGPDMYNLEAVGNKDKHMTEWARYNDHDSSIDIISSCHNGHRVKVSCASFTCSSQYLALQSTSDTDRVNEGERKGNDSHNEDEEEDEEGEREGNDSHNEDEEEDEEGEREGNDSHDEGEEENEEKKDGRRKKSLDSLKPQLRIVGGKDALPFVWNFLVGINRNSILLCGGSILTTSWVLTAAHCVIYPESAVYEVHAGMVRRDSWSPHEQSSLVTHIIVHEKYDKKFIRNDLALFKLQTPLHMNRFVRPVCLSRTYKPQKGEVCTVAGFGNLAEDGGLPMNLQEVDLPIKESCRRETAISDEEVVCAGLLKGKKDSCQGDSGGPLMCHAENNNWLQVGIVSFGRGCARPGHAGVYVRVSYHIKWIEKTLELMKDLPKGVKSLCDGVTCQLGHGTCLSAIHVCDGQADCLNAEDELWCGEHSTISTTSPPHTTEDQHKSTTISTMEYNDGQGESGENHEHIDYDIPMTTSTTTTSTTVTEVTSSLYSPTVINAAGDEEVCRTIHKTMICQPEEFLCHNMPQCVPMEEVCNGEPDCRDGTDEIACTCMDHLANANRDDLECNGFYDCYDLSDENCDPCEGLFPCVYSRYCLPMEKVCNAERDCKFGEDEAHCAALINIGELPERDRTGAVLSQAEGLMIWRPEGVWQTVCTEAVPNVIARIMCIDIGYTDFKDVYTIKQDVMFFDTHGRNRRSPAQRTRLQGRQITNNFLGNTSSSALRNHRYIRSPGDYGVEETVSEYIWARMRREMVAGVLDRTEGCSHLVVKCEDQRCGTTPVFFASKEVQPWRFGGSPWAASVYVGGVYMCGATLIHPSWVITSRTCMANVSLQESLVSAVMGTWQAVGIPTRLFSAYEYDRPVVAMRVLADSDILLLALSARMPKTPYINFICLPDKSVQDVYQFPKCSISGVSKEYARETIGAPFVSSRDCPSDYVCPEFKGDFSGMCMDSWAGAVACELQGYLPFYASWTAVGMWTYKPPGKDCAPARHHKLFTDKELQVMRLIIESPIVAEENLAECKGRRCVTSVCVTPTMECNGFLDCPDMSDELPHCQPPAHHHCPIDNLSECECTQGFWQCRDKRCIPGEKLCDGVRDCPDGDDEADDCSCCKVLMFWSPEKRCDGNVDCDDQQDEMDCGCDGFRCFSSESQKCLEKAAVCDGKQDCKENEDELYCLTLSKTLKPQEDVFSQPVHFPSGYLLVRISGTWFTYDYSRWQSYLSHLVCLQLDFYRAAKTKMLIVTEESVWRANYGNEGITRERNIEVEGKSEVEGEEEIYNHGNETQDEGIGTGEGEEQSEGNEGGGKEMSVVWIECETEFPSTTTSINSLPYLSQLSSEEESGVGT